MRNRIRILLLLSVAGWVHNKVVAQTDHKVYIGMYCVDPDGLIDGVNGDPVGYDDAYIGELKKYGFNLIIGFDPTRTEVTGSFTPSLGWLDRIHAAGMKAIVINKNFDIAKPRYNISCGLATPATVYNSTKVNYGLTHYNSHPALAGYFVADEPCKKTELGTSLWTTIGQVSNQIHIYDNTKMAYVNLFPMGAANSQLEFNSFCSGSSYTYNDYLNDYLSSMTQVDMIGFDAYPWWNIYAGCDLTVSFFQNLDLVATKAKNNDIPFYFVTHVFQTGYNYSPPICSDTIRSSNIDGIDDMNVLRFNFFSGMIHSAKGVLYWLREEYYQNPYTAPLSNFTFEFDQEMTTTTKQDLGTIHQKILDHAYELGRLKYVASYHATGLPLMGQYLSGTTPFTIPSHMEWADFLADPATIDIFNIASPVSPAPTFSTSSPNAVDYLAFAYAIDPGGKKYLWMMNKNIDPAAAPASFALSFNSSKTVIDVLEDQICWNIAGINVELEGGEGKLFLIEDYIPTNNISWDFPGLDETYLATTINILNGVDITGSSKDRFYASEININYTVTITPNASGDVIIEGNEPYCSTFRMTEDTGHEMNEHLAVAEHIELSGLEVYPNPNDGEFTARINGDPDKTYQLCIHSMFGQEVYNKPTQGDRFIRLSLGYLPAGIYIVTLKYENEMIETIKTIVKP